MPKVGKKHFSYSKAGRKAAKAYGRKLAQEMEEAHDPTDAQIKQAAADEKKAGKKTKEEKKQEIKDAKEEKKIIAKEKKEDKKDKDEKAG